MRYLLFAAVLAVVIPSLQGCFPLVAAGAGTGVLMAEDRRTAGIFVEDQSIELKTRNRLAEEFRDQVNVSVTSYNRTVLLTGQTPSEELKQKAESIAKDVPNVRNVINEVEVGTPTSFSTRSNDAYITSKVKARFLDARRFQPNHVKVVTENGVVYLMGIVRAKEAEDAVELARSTSGVRKVVKVFEYIE